MNRDTVAPEIFTDDVFPLSVRSVYQKKIRSVKTIRATLPKTTFFLFYADKVTGSNKVKRNIKKPSLVNKTIIKLKRYPLKVFLSFPVIINYFNSTYLICFKVLVPNSLAPSIVQD